ncbi:DNA-3-methyladenine glycosylase 2 family protein [Roseiconus nitratireducens]|uniref:DNA-3-methyladenine glycosylase II n=1 Tax=Roseiconus nitratireducens TaxID=2605748 RepID=A0A5M6DMI4_9BACT|nr:DNA-3-methyladenine glycosylase 2 family protein [Roseiconus nitratireducens]
MAGRDPALAKVLQAHGPPPLLRRPASLGTLVQIILEQQVSVESAKATYLRFREACGTPIRPDAIVRLDVPGLRQLGFSRQKARYTLALAHDCLEKRFRIQSLSRMNDEAVREQIVARLGLGHWSADVFLMTALLRPDVLPVGDLGLIKGIEEIDQTEYATPQAVIERARSWRPLRSIATRMVWQWYVHGRGRDIF